MRPWGCPNNEGKLCEKSTEVEINLEEVKVVKNSEHTNKIMIDDNIGVIMDYPNTSSIQKEEGDAFTVGLNFVKNGIKMVFTKEETFERDSFSEEELGEFIDSLSSDQFQKIKTFFDTMPMLKHTVKYKCGTCGEDKETTIEGMNSFFS